MRPRALPVVLTALGLLAGCAEPAATKGAPRTPTSGARAADASAPLGYATDDAAWGTFHSKRFQLTVPLPAGRQWTIDDHRSAELVASHPPTDSHLTVLVTHEAALMNRERCEARARALGWVTKPTLTTVDDQVIIGPDAFDSRVWVVLDATKDGGGLEGHVYLFGASLRRCLLVHLTTSVPSSRDEGVLAARLAVGSARIVKAIATDPPRTTDGAVLPRDKPGIRR